MKTSRQIKPLGIVRGVSSSFEPFVSQQHNSTGVVKMHLILATNFSCKVCLVVVSLPPLSLELFVQHLTTVGPITPQWVHGSLAPAAYLPIYHTEVYIPSISQLSTPHPSFPLVHFGGDKVCDSLHPLTAVPSQSYKVSPTALGK